jgi:hypothetical protein
MATLRKPKAVYRTVRHHAALNAGHTLTVSGARQEPVDVFLRQSDMDSACAHHCVAMALIILGLVKRSAVINQAKRKTGIAAQLYQALSDGWFEGLHAKPLLEALHRMELTVKLRLRDNFEGVDAFAVEALQKGLLTLLAYESERNRHRHWVLGVGLSGFQTGESFAVDTLLVLCPSSDPVPLASHNARLHCEQATKFTKTSESASWQFESMPYSSEPVRLMSAISLEPSELHDNFHLHE